MLLIIFLILTQIYQTCMKLVTALNFLTLFIYAFFSSLVKPNVDTPRRALFSMYVLFSLFLFFQRDDITQ